MSERRFALIIANAEYDDDKLGCLESTWGDATGLAQVLQEPTIGDFAAVETFIDAGAQDVRDAVARFFKGKERDDLLLVYFSGHGVLDPDDEGLYLAVKDTETDMPSARGIEARFLTQHMDRSRSRRIVLIFINDFLSP
jgi:uncharacterized caspase-like protein